MTFTAAFGAACGSDPEPDPCLEVDGSCIAIMPGADAEEIQTAMIEASEGSTIAFTRGRFVVDTGLSLDVDGVTIVGQGMDDTTIDFEDQTDGAQGLLVTGDDFTIQDIGIEDAPGDILKIEGTDGVEIVRVRAEYTCGPCSTNGAYALYPVQCSNVHIADSYIRGASDAGVYVGQSTNIIVENNFVTENVAGIEIENSSNADVHDNESTANTGGLLVFNLPDPPIDGAGTRVYQNNVHDNNTENFAPSGTVAIIPPGTGILLFAAHQIEVFDNTVANHDTLNVGVASFTTSELPYEDPTYDPDPDTIEIHNNELVGESTMPTGELGALVILALLEVQSTVSVPDIIWDGVVPPEKADPDDPLKLMDALNICIHDNGDATFGNLHWPNQTEPEADFDASPHDCDHPALPAVTLE